MCSKTTAGTSRRFRDGRALSCALLALLTPPVTLSAQAPVPKTYFACYVPLAGTVYRIKEPGLPDKCFGPSSGILMHVQFSWTDGADALRAGEAVGGDLEGTFPNPTVGKLRGIAVSAAVPTAGQVLAFDGTIWTPTAPPAGGASGTSANTPNTLVERDGAGGFAAGALTLDGKLDQTSIDGFVAQGTLNSGSIPATGAGTRMMWYPRKAAFRAGRSTGAHWDDSSVGEGSVALGVSTIANQFASTALGFGSTASSIYSLAAGESSVASGIGSVALGRFNNAGGSGSVALGDQTVATGNYSTAIGHFASTNGNQGSFVFGDASTITLWPNPIHLVTATAPNQFVVRAAGGFRLRTSPDLSTGCDLPSGSGVWACTSSRDLKTAFAPVDGEELLHDVASVPVTTWSYRTENPAVRHLGPTAQDFRAAFGLGTDDTSIGLLDISGVAFAGVQALEKRTAELRAAMRELETLRAEVAALRVEAAASKAERVELARRLTALESPARK